jgi:hypothetical protein
VVGLERWLILLLKQICAVCQCYVVRAAELHMSCPRQAMLSTSGQAVL